MLRPLAIAGLYLLALGCGGVGTSNDLDAACTARAQARCAKRDQCSDGASIVRVFGDMNTCLSREKLSCTLSLTAAQTGNSPALVLQCANAYATQACTDFFNGLLPDPCMPTGARGPGDVCTFNAQCQSGYCGGSRDSICGTCATPPAAGDPCSTDNCAAGMSCIASTQLCQPFGATGDACDAGHSCGADLSCVTSGGTGSCTPTADTAGATCDATHPCDGTKGLHCESHSGTKTCTPNQYVGDGMSCGTVGASFVGCGSGGSCYTSTGVTVSGETGTCKAAAADGAACDVVVGPPCLNPARCIVTAGQTQGICVVADPRTCG
jgi:hypothetical protein